MVNLVQTSSDQLLFILKLYIFFIFAKQYLNEEVHCTEPSPSVKVPWSNICAYGALTRVNYASLSKIEPFNFPGINNLPYFPPATK